MENASKALIIAGAILISILLISVGIIIMNAINNPVQKGADSASGQAIEMFNSKFVGYSGTIKGSSVKTLVSTVNASNATDEQHQIRLVGPENLPLANIRPNRDYTARLVYREARNQDATVGTVYAGGGTITSEQGYICEIVIAE